MKINGAEITENEKQKNLEGNFDFDTSICNLFRNDINWTGEGRERNY